jgi:hypothetical protein
MSGGRLVLVGLVVAALIALLGWQTHRERLVRVCLDTGGEWDGPRSLCREPVRPILQRDYQRSRAFRSGLQSA